MGCYSNETNTKNSMEETKHKKKKGLIGKVKDIASEKEYQVEFVGL